MNKLPEKAAKKMASLSNSAADSEALARSVPQRVLKLGERIASLGHLRSTFDERDKRSEEIRQQIAQAQDEQELLRETAKRRAELAKNDATIIKNIQEWMRTLPQGMALVDVSTATPNVTDPVAGITAARSQIETLKGRLRELRGKTLPREELQEKAKQHVKCLADQAKLTLTGISRDKPFGVEVATQDPLAVIAAVAPRQLLIAIEGLIEELPADGMSAEERKKQVAKLERLLLAVEMEEEALIVQARLQGNDVLRRPRTDIRAILGVEVVTKPPKKKCSALDEDFEKRMARSQRKKTAPEVIVQG